VNVSELVAESEIRQRDFTCSLILQDRISKDKNGHGGLLVDIICPDGESIAAGEGNPK
jgi:hypothetical protein